jgi:Domain of unknown function (DUF1906)
VAVRGRLRALLVAVAVAIALAASPAGASAAGVVYTGGGFDTCSAPRLATMQSWLASPYRAVGVYVGGTNRACPDGNLSAGWAANVIASGWNLLPLYVGLQAPCVQQTGLALIDPSNAAAQGTAAADDAVGRAAAFGLGAGTPVYFDMEGYKTGSGSCTQTVQTFLGAWSARLHERGYLSGVYGSAASTIRDVILVAGNPVLGPDAVWIANWNSKPQVFGDPYVPDSLWANHQRVHQDTGGHGETYAGVTLNIDGDAVDGPVVGPAPTTGTPAPQPQAGTLTTSDGQATVTWPANALPAGATVAATPTTLPADTDGFAAGSYVLQLTVRNAKGSAVTRLGAPLQVVFATPQQAAIPAITSDSKTWQPLSAQAPTGLPAGATTSGYSRGTDGSVTVTLAAPAAIGLLRDIAPPTPPAGLQGRFVGGKLVLAWQPATDNAGSVAAYDISLNDQSLTTVSGATTASVRSFYPHGHSIFRVTASDAAGNTSPPSTAVTVVPSPRPTGIPTAIPNWAYQLAAWQQAHRAGTRPAAPRVTPAWYWRWRGWRLHPFRTI